MAGADRGRVYLVCISDYVVADLWPYGLAVWVMDISWSFDGYGRGGHVVCRFGRYEAFQAEHGACAVEKPDDDDQGAIAYHDELLRRHRETGKIWEGDPPLIKSDGCKCGDEHAFPFFVAVCGGN